MKKIILACMMLFPFMGIAAQENETRNVELVYGILSQEKVWNYKQHQTAQK